MRSGYLSATTRAILADYAAPEAPSQGALAVKYGVSRQHVCQVVGRAVTRGAVFVPRGHRGPPMVPLVQRRCEVCGAVRELLPGKARALGPRCQACYAKSLIKWSPDVVEGWIKRRLAGARWAAILREQGMPPKATARLQMSLFAYLRRNDRLAEMPAIWWGTSVRWMINQGHREAEICLRRK